MSNFQVTILVFVAFATTFAFWIFLAILAVVAPLLREIRDLLRKTEINSR